MNQQPHQKQPQHVIPRGWRAGPWPRMSPVILLAASMCMSFVSGGVFSGALFIILFSCLHVLLSDTWSWSHLYEGIQIWVLLQMLSMVFAGISIIVMTFRPDRDPERQARFARARTIARLMAGAVMILSEASALTAVAMISLCTVWTLCERQFDLPGIAAPWVIFIASQVFFTILSSFVFFLRTEKWDLAEYLGWDERHERQF